MISLICLGASIINLQLSSKHHSVLKKTHKSDTKRQTKIKKINSRKYHCKKLHKNNNYTNTNMQRFKNNKSTNQNN